MNKVNFKNINIMKICELTRNKIGLGPGLEAIIFRLVKLFLNILKYNARIKISVSDLDLHIKFI